VAHVLYAVHCFIVFLCTCKARTVSNSKFHCKKRNIQILFKPVILQLVLFEGEIGLTELFADNKICTNCSNCVLVVLSGSLKHCSYGTLLEYLQSSSSPPSSLLKQIGKKERNRLYDLEKIITK
jgi:hypothetical protein